MDSQIEYRSTFLVHSKDMKCMEHLKLAPIILIWRVLLHKVKGNAKGIEY